MRQEIVVEGRRVNGVVTNGGAIGCDILVNCAGIWAKRVGAMAGVAGRRRRRRAPVFPDREEARLRHIAHHAARPRPQLLSQARHRRLRHRRLGGGHQGAAGAACRRSSSAASCSPPNLERLELFAIPAARAAAGAQRHRHPDGHQRTDPGLRRRRADHGPAPELDNFFLACGFTAGIAASGGAGEAMANWILDGDPGMDLWSVRRPPLRRRCRRRAATSRSGRSRPMAPTTRSTGRARRQHCGARPAPLAALRSAEGRRRGVRLEVRLGACQLVRPRRARPRTISRASRASPTGSLRSRDEHRAIRERVALIDQTSFAKFEISGTGALAALDRIAANDLSGRARQGRLHPALQRARRHRGRRHHRPCRAGPASTSSPARASASATRAGSRAHLPETACTMRDVTGAYATINICGPAGARRAADGQRRRSLQRGLSLPRARRRSRSAIARVLPCASAMSASWATSSTCRRSMPPHVYDTLWAGGPAARHRQRRLSRHRILPPGEGLSLLVRRHHARLQPLRGRARLLPSRSTRATSSAGTRSPRSRPRGRGAKLVLLHRRGFAPFHGGEPIVARRPRGRLHHQRRLRPHARQDHRLRLSAGRACGGRKDFEIEAFGTRYRGHARPALPLRSEDGAAEGMSDDRIRATSATPARFVGASRCSPAASRRATITRLGGLTNRVFRIEQATALPAPARRGHGGIHRPRQRGDGRARGGARPASARRCSISIQRPACW